MLSACRPKTANSCSKREFSSLALTSSCVIIRTFSSAWHRSCQRFCVALESSERRACFRWRLRRADSRLDIIRRILFSSSSSSSGTVSSSARSSASSFTKHGGDAGDPTTTFASAAAGFGGAAGLAWVLARVGAGLPFGDDDSSLTTGFASGNPHPALALVARLSATIGSLFVRFS